MWKKIGILILVTVLVLGLGGCTLKKESTPKTKTENQSPKAASESPGSTPTSPIKSSGPAEDVAAEESEPELKGIVFSAYGPTEGSFSIPPLSLENISDVENGQVNELGTFDMPSGDPGYDIGQTFWQKMGDGIDYSSDYKQMLYEREDMNHNNELYIASFDGSNLNLGSNLLATSASDWESKKLDLTDPLFWEEGENPKIIGLDGSELVIANSDGQRKILKDIPIFKNLSLVGVDKENKIAYLAYKSDPNWSGDSFQKSSKLYKVKASGSVKTISIEGEIFGVDVSSQTAFSARNKGSKIEIIATGLEDSHKEKVSFPDPSQNEGPSLKPLELVSTANNSSHLKLILGCGQGTPLNFTEYLVDFSSKKGVDLKELFKAESRDIARAVLSPDGRKIAFLSRKKPDETVASVQVPYDVWIYDLGSKQLKNLTNQGCNIQISVLGRGGAFLDWK